MVFSLGAVITKIVILNFCAYFLCTHIKFALNFFFSKNTREGERERETFISDLQLIAYYNIYHYIILLRHRK